MSENEVMHVDETTGARKAFNLQMVALIPVKFILALARHYGVGSQKYAKNNWRLGYDWEFSYNSAQRHLMAFWDGEDIDPDTGSPHVIAAAWHCAALHTFMAEHPELDSRWSTVQRRERDNATQDVAEGVDRATS